MSPTTADRPTALVTGGLGRSGRWIADRLAGDYDVVCVDRNQPGFEVPERPHVDFRAVDLTDRGATFDLVGDLDPDAVVHWAAIPSPTRHAGGEVFETNTLATYNVLVAAGRAGARVVQASSESAYGFPFAEETPLPDFLPVTESHPCRPEDPYGLSKVVGEETAESVVRRYGVPVVSVRPSWIQYPGEYACRSLPSVEAVTATDSSADLDREALAAGAGNCWSYVDVRDVADLVAAALDAPPEDDAGEATHEAVHAAAADTYLGVPTAEAVEAYFGRLPEDCTLEGEASALSTAKAAALFDWSPAHVWREAADESVLEPSLLAE
ncbi:NAD-dependent epimerase/dehydratase family protein [Halobium salinum]|uniref:NAD-dependent epimerase/dehydratase family protein n=1 Tax=Halobium salinum TaxID=1364940 RepID=A0ABD5PFK6_9EURY|nr:NAD(P)-dependent oxidoreductase [Halobium salinum]